MWVMREYGVSDSLYRFKINKLPDPESISSDIIRIPENGTVIGIRFVRRRETLELIKCEKKQVKRVNGTNSAASGPLKLDRQWHYPELLVGQIKNNNSLLLPVKVAGPMKRFIEKNPVYNISTVAETLVRCCNSFPRVGSR
ncbi:hypothetical protein FF1_045827 [Malus domestica]